MSYPILYDGHDLESLFLVDWHIDRELTPWQPDIVDAPGAVGSLFGGTQAQPISVSMQLTIIAKSRDERQEALRTLAGWLAVDSPRVLQLADEGGRYRMAVPTGNAGVSALLDADTVQISFTCPDPRLWGKRRTVTCPKDGSVTFSVGGTAPSMPTVTTTVAASAAGQQWTLTLEDGTYLLYQPTYTGALQSRALAIDCAERTLTVDGATKMLSPLADWLTLAPGEHTLTMGGEATGGAATIAWHEMWW